MEEFDIFKMMTDLLNNAGFITEMAMIFENTLDIKLYTFVFDENSRKKISVSKTINCISHYSSKDICEVLRSLSFELQGLIEGE